MPDLSKPLFITGVTMSAFASGAIFGMTALNVPSLLAGLNHPTIDSSASTSSSKLTASDATAPPETAVLLTQWRKIYAIGVKLVPSICLGASATYLLNAWLHYAPTGSAVGNALGGPWGTRRSLLLVAAAIVNIGMVPYTAILMRACNTELHRREEQGRDVTGEWTQWDPDHTLKAEGSSESLIRKWGTLSAVRAIFPLAAVLLAFEAL